MKKITLIAALLLTPFTAFGGVSSGYSDCATQSSKNEIFKLTLGQVAESLNLQPKDLFSADAHFNTGLSEAEKRANIVGQGKYGSYKTTLHVEQDCKSADGGMKMTLTVPNTFNSSQTSMIIGSADKVLVDTNVRQSLSKTSIELDGEYLKAVIDLSSTSLPELLREGRFAKNIQVSIYNKKTGALLEGLNNL